MDYLVLPRANEARGTVRVPSSKSATNRALVLAAISSEAVELVRPLRSEDTAALVRCLSSMGARITDTADGISVGGPLSADPSSEVSLDARDSGTAARFLAALATATPGRFLLDGSPRLRERPMGELIDALRSAGAVIDYVRAEGHLPLAIRGGGLTGGTIEVDCRRSSQFFSALLLAGAALEGGLTVRARDAVASAPYVEMTVEALKAFGHEARRDGGGFTVVRGRASATHYEIPGDHSAALPLLAAAGAAGGRVTVQGVSKSSSAPDARALYVLEKMGVEVTSAPDHVTAACSRHRLSPVAVEAMDFPDSVPTLAALAALAEGESHLAGIAHLRWKESDRLRALAALISAAGASCEARETELVVVGPARRRSGTILPTFQDHRIAMAAALLSIAHGGHLIENPGCVAKSYPAFFRDLSSLIR